MSAPPAGAAPGLLRGIRRWDLLALMVNGTIGAGIFGLPSRIYALVGPWSLPAFVACAALIAIVILCFAEVASRFESTGGPYLYARTAFGPMVGFVMGWLLWLVRLTSFAALCNLLVTYLHVLWPPADLEPWRTLVIVTVTVGLAAINFVGVRNAALTGNVFAIGKLVPLVLLIVVGLAFVAPARLAPGALPAAGTFPKAMLLLVFAFTGFELVLIPAGEASDPRRNLPLAMLSGLGVVALVYVLIQVVCVGTLPELATSQRPLTDAAARLMGPPGACSPWERCSRSPARSAPPCSPPRGSPMRWPKAASCRGCWRRRIPDSARRGTASCSPPRACWAWPFPPRSSARSRSTP